MDSNYSITPEGHKPCLCEKRFGGLTCAQDEQNLKCRKEYVNTVMFVELERTEYGGPYPKKNIFGKYPTFRDTSQLGKCWKKTIFGRYRIDIPCVKTAIQKYEACQVQPNEIDNLNRWRKDNPEKNVILVNLNPFQKIHKPDTDGGISILYECACSEKQNLKQ